MLTKLINHCINHFMVYVSEIIMLYTLNLYSAVCQLHLNKNWKKKTHISGIYCMGKWEKKEILIESLRYEKEW